jgi:flagellar hook assembly protein FlgD
LRIDYWDIEGGDVQIRVYNVRGTTIRHLSDLTLPAGSYTVYWDGKDDNGESVYSGLYIVAVIEPKRVEFKKVSVVKE